MLGIEAIKNILVLPDASLGIPLDSWALGFWHVRGYIMNSVTLITYLLALEHKGMHTSPSPSDI